MPLLPRRYPIVLPLMAALYAGACAEAGNFEPVGTRPLDPPGLYRTWWSEVEACAQISAPFDRVDWYEADHLINTERDSRHPGAWRPPHAIYVSSRHLLSRPVVKHEIVHDLLQRKDHGSPLFLRCAGH